MKHEVLKPEFDAGIDDKVTHPEHYKSAAVTVTYEPIDLASHYSFCIGNAIKYILRAPYKGQEVSDWKKALFYLEYWEKVAVDNEDYEEQPIRGIYEARASIKAYKETNRYIDTLIFKNGVIYNSGVERCMKMIKDTLNNIKQETNSQKEH